MTLLMWDTAAGGEAEEVVMTEERGVWTAQVHREYPCWLYKQAIKMLY